MGLKTVYSNIKFFIFQLICILAKMVITFEPVGIFSCGFRCCTQDNKFCHLNHVFYSTLPLSSTANSAVPSQQKTIHTSLTWTETHSLKYRVLLLPEKVSRSCYLTWILTKATGPDSIPSRFLKEYADEVTAVLTLIFQASL